MKNKIIIIAIIFIIAIAGIFVIKNRQSRYDYEITKITSFEYFTLMSNEKYGIINKNGDIIIKPNYTDKDNLGYITNIEEYKEIVVKAADSFSNNSEGNITEQPNMQKLSNLEE